MYFCMQNNHFLFKIISKFTQKRIIRKSFQNISSRELPHNKRVSAIFIFLYKKYIKKWYFLKFFKVKIGSKYTSKRTKLHPPNKAHGDMQISKYQKKNPTSPPQSWGRPCVQ